MNKAIFSVAFVGTMFLSGPHAPAEDLPVPTITEYFKTEGGGFISVGNTVKYAIEIKPRKRVNGSKPWFARIEYENPEDVNAPLVQDQEFPPNKETFSIQSDALAAIKNRKTYRVTLKAYEDPGRTILITTHSIDIRFDVPDELAKSWGLKLL